MSRRPTPGAPHATAAAVARRGASQAIAMVVTLRTAKREHPRARIESQLATHVLVNAGA